MANIRNSILCALLILALPLGLFPIAPAKQAHADSYSQDASVEDLPTDAQLRNASSDQLLVTYKQESPQLDDDLRVAGADGKDPQEVVRDAPDSSESLNDLGATSTSDIDEMDPHDGKGATSVVTFEEGTDLQMAAAQLLTSPDVESVQPNYEYKLSGVGDTSFYDKSSKHKSAYHPTNDPYSYVSDEKTLNQSYVYTTKLADAWKKGYKSSGRVSIAVIDTGVRTDHPDLASVVDLTYARDFSNNDNVNGLPYMDSPSSWTGKSGVAGHGTWVSGILGSAANNGKGIAGASYNAKIIPMKVTNGSSLYTSTIVQAYSYLDKIVESGRLSSLKVINLSLGGKESDPALKNIITHMADAHNILTVASAGNEGDRDHMYPADYSNVLSVMGVSWDFKRSYFSSYGGKDISAPAEDITTTAAYSRTWNSADSGKYISSGIDGTSFAAPIVAGAAALCYAAKSNATAAEVRMAIKSSGTSLSKIDKTCAPLLNALKAAQSVRDGTAMYLLTHKSISGASVSKVSSRTYTGKSIKPSVKVKLSGKTLKNGRDYKVSYSSNKNPGTATMTIRGIGAYRSTKKVTFKIVPKSSKIVSIKRSSGGFSATWARNLKCASGYQVKYSSSKRTNSAGTLRYGNVLTVRGASKRMAHIFTGRSKVRYYVQVRTYKISKHKAYYSKWSSIRSVKTK